MIKLSSITVSSVTLSDTECSLFTFNYAVDTQLYQSVTSVLILTKTCLHFKSYTFTVQLLYMETLIFIL